MNTRSQPINAGTFRRLAGIAFFIGIAALFGCQANTSSISDSSAQSANGSFPSSNQADGLPAINFVDQHGNRVSLAALKGRPVLLDFIYARCATACPVLTARFANIARLLGANLGAKVTMVSVTIDPENDHPSDLLEYAKTHGADYKGWLFLTGEPADVDALLRNYKLRRERQPDGTISHIAIGFLIGPDGKQLRMYDAMEVPANVIVADLDRTVPGS